MKEVYYLCNVPKVCCWIISIREQNFNEICQNQLRLGHCSIIPVFILIIHQGGQQMAQMGQSKHLYCTGRSKNVALNLTKSGQVLDSFIVSPQALICYKSKTRIVINTYVLKETWLIVAGRVRSIRFINHYIHSLQENEFGKLVRDKLERLDNY